MAEYERTDQYAGSKNKMSACDATEGRNYRPTPNPPLGTDKAQSIRNEQTRDWTQPRSSYHSGQFPYAKARRHSLRGNR